VYINIELIAVLLLLSLYSSLCLGCCCCCCCCCCCSYYYCQCALRVRRPVCVFTFHRLRRFIAIFMFIRG